MNTVRIMVITALGIVAVWGTYSAAQVDPLELAGVHQKLDTLIANQAAIREDLATIQEDLIAVKHLTYRTR
jgi:hypothetical protein